jgi:hypothetical protein
MKTSKLLSVSLAAGLAGVVLAKLASISALAALPGANLFAVGAGFAVAGLAAYDYSRRHQPLQPRVPTLARPSLPASCHVAPAGLVNARGNGAVRERTAA